MPLVEWGMSTDLFAGIPVSDYAAAVAWYERLFGAPPTSPSSTATSAAPQVTRSPKDRLQVLRLDRMHDVVVADHRPGDHHRGEDDRQDAGDAGQDRPPGQGEGEGTYPVELVVDEDAQGDPERQTVEQGGQPVEQALVAQHAPEATRRQPDRPEHGDLAPAQLDVGIQG